MVVINKNNNLVITGLEDFLTLLTDKIKIIEIVEISGIRDVEIPKNEGFSIESKYWVSIKGVAYSIMCLVGIHGMVQEVFLKVKNRDDLPVLQKNLNKFKI